MLKTKSILGKIPSIISIILYLVLGIVAICSKDAFSSSIGLIFGIMLIVSGVSFMIYAFYTRFLLIGSNFLMIQGVVITLFGIFLCSYKEVSLMLITYGLGSYLIFNGFCKLVSSFDLKRFNVSSWWLSIIFGCLYIVCGSMMFAFTNTSSTIISIIMGVMLILYALINLCDLIDEFRREKREKIIINNINKHIHNNDFDKVDFDFTNKE